MQLRKAFISHTYKYSELLLMHIVRSFKNHYLFLLQTQQNHDCSLRIGDVDMYMDTFLDTEATKKAVIQAGTAIFQYLYHEPNLTLGEIRYRMFSRKAVAGVIKPETLPPTEGAAVQHSLRAYLQTRNWILLQSMSLNPCDYGWTL